MRQDTRNFMLRRIVGKVTPVKLARESKTFEPPAQELIDAAINDLDALAERQTALIKVKPDTEAWFRYELDLVTGKKTDEVEIHYHDIYVLAEQLREYANEIEVVRPESLANFIRAGFEKVADQHA
jgi:proteasome accessory factor B